MAFNLKKILKAMLTSTSEPLSVKDVQTVVTRYHEQREKDGADVPAGADEADGNGENVPAQALIEDIINQVPTLLTATQIREAVAELNQEMEDSGDVTRILQGPEGFRMTIAPDYADWIRLLRNDPRPQKLTQAALETLAVVAYRQRTAQSRACLIWSSSPCPVARICRGARRSFRRRRSSLILSDCKRFPNCRNPMCFRRRKFPRGSNARKIP